MNKLSFWVINFIISSNLLKYPTFFIIFWFVATEHPYWPKFIWNNTLYIVFLFLIPTLIIALYWIIKINIFIFILKISKKNSYTHVFFEKCQQDSKFIDNIQNKSILFDISFVAIEALILYIIALNSNTLYEKTILDYLIRSVIGFLVCGGGVLLSYINLENYLNKK